MIELAATLALAALTFVACDAIHAVRRRMRTTTTEENR